MSCSMSTTVSYTSYFMSAMSCTARSVTTKSRDT